MRKKRKEQPKRTARIDIRCTEEEKRSILKHAQEQKKNLSDYILSVVNRNNAIPTKVLITDRIELIDTMNGIYHEVVKRGDTLLIASVEKLMEQMGEGKNEIRKSL